MRDEGLGGGGGWAAEDPEPAVPEQFGSAATAQTPQTVAGGPPPQFAPGPQAILGAGKGQAAAASVDLPVPGTPPEGQARTPLRVARGRLLLGGGLIGLLMVAGLGVLIALSVAASRAVDPSRQVDVYRGGARRRS